jgi:prepilin-type N-terminal cleavage/methylation domain-containing protein
MDQTKSLALLTILNRNRKKAQRAKSISRGSHGFTLIEVLLVLAIIVLVLSFGMPVVSRITGQNISTSARKFTALIRGVRSDAILLNSIYRLSIDLEKNTYLIEQKSGGGLISESALLSQKPDPKKKMAQENPSTAFSPSEKYNKGAKALPGGVVFNGVLKEKEGLVKEGVAYIYFFPNGINERAIIYLNASSAKEGGYSLVIHPTAGKVDFFKQKVEQFQ